MEAHGVPQRSRGGAPQPPPGAVLCRHRRQLRVLLLLALLPGAALLPFMLLRSDLQNCSCSWSCMSPLASLHPLHPSSSGSPVSVLCSDALDICPVPLDFILSMHRACLKDLAFDSLHPARLMAALMLLALAQPYTISHVVDPFVQLEFSHAMGQPEEATTHADSLSGCQHHTKRPICAEVSIPLCLRRTAR